MNYRYFPEAVHTASTTFTKHEAPPKSYSNSVLRLQHQVYLILHDL